MEQFARMALLADFYGPLLTPKQGRIWDFHYEQDLSLVEIAELENTSRQAVYDLLKRTEKILKGYEAKLGLVDRFMNEHHKLAEVNQLIQEFSQKDFSNTEAWERHQSVRQMVDELCQDIEAS